MTTGMAINTMATKTRAILAIEAGKLVGRFPWACNDAIRVCEYAAPTQIARPGQPHNRIETRVRMIAVVLFIVYLFQ
jgi:hypothetical protein